jgi:hypothetical protein
MNHYPLLQADMDSLADHLAIAVYDINEEYRMGAIDRIKAKALQASSIAPTMLKNFEADLDSLIAEGPKLDAERKAAVAGHMDVVTGIRGEFADMRSAIDILSNGGPPLDESAAFESSSAPPPLPDQPRIDTGEVIRPKLST